MTLAVQINISCEFLITSNNETQAVMYLPLFKMARKHVQEKKSSSLFGFATLSSDGFRDLFKRAKMKRRKTARSSK